jgi:hypothetical protein
MEFYTEFLKKPNSRQILTLAVERLDESKSRPDSLLWPPFQNSVILPIIGPHPDGLA